MPRLARGALNKSSLLSSQDLSYIPVMRISLPGSLGSSSIVDVKTGNKYDPSGAKAGDGSDRAIAAGNSLNNGTTAPDTTAATTATLKGKGGNSNVTMIRPEILAALDNCELFDV